MDRDACWRAIADHRRSVADLLADLADDEWERPSLCAEWRIRDVAAHLAMTPLHPPMLGVLADAVRARGDFDVVNRDMARRHAAALGSTELVAELREHAGSRRKPVITTYRNLLFDVLVHSQDIALPLGRELPLPADAVRAGLDRVWAMGWPFHARRRLAGVRLTATDLDWSAGTGPEVAGPAAPLLLLLTGRTAAALGALSGPGTTRLPAPAGP
jgi:uncharacterized protein (TIGR03083 family)